MEKLSERVGRDPDLELLPGADGTGAGAIAAGGTAPGIDRGAEPRLAERRRRLGLAVAGLRPAITVYLATRGLLVLVALLDGALRHHSFTHELANWDGLWYGQLANHGYPTHVSHAPSTLGFFPLYPIVMWLTAHVFSVSSTIAGVLISGAGGLVATVLVQRLATGWWGEQSGRRAAVLFCVFPGSVVFSMVYAEGLFIPLAVGCILALERRRWLLAGALAGIATATEPEGLVLVLVCAASALGALRGRRWRQREARKSLLAPLLSLSGVAAFAAFLWLWAGTPLASLEAQRYGWHEKTDPFALVALARSLAAEISFAHFNHPTINLNLIVGLLGAVLLFVGLALLIRRRGRISVPAMVWSIGVGLLAVTSEYLPPNPRLLITAFPAVLVFAHYVGRRGYCWLLGANVVLLAGLSALTFIGTTLRP
ncbi:MAG: mannosyltransferase family protein [Solirubrobacteraceae bacterium]